MKRLTYHHVKSATKNFNLVLLVAIIITGVIITWLGFLIPLQISNQKIIKNLTTVIMPIKIPVEKLSAILIKFENKKQATYDFRLLNDKFINLRTSVKLQDLDKVNR
ncbi:MAG: hypothetical protein AAB657_03580 [Patescibacteria group bacterium]